MKNGITSGHKRNWNNRFGSKLGSTRLIYLFSDYTSAVRWAARMEWDFRDQGNPEIVIIRIQFTGYGRRDEHWENDGSWWTTVDPIPPDQIIDVIPLTLEMKREVAQTDKATPPALPLDEKVKVLTIHSGWTRLGGSPIMAENLRVFENPLRKEFEVAVQEVYAMDGEPSLRGIAHDGRVWVWNAEKATHDALLQNLGLHDPTTGDFNYKNPAFCFFMVYTSTSSDHPLVLSYNGVANNIEVLKNTVAKRWKVKIIDGGPFMAR